MNQNQEFEYRGYKCLIRKYFGGFNNGGAGYVAIPKGHEFYGKGDVGIDCHGGITYTSFERPDKQEKDENKNKDEKTEYWVGFDMCHFCSDKDFILGISYGELCTLDSLRKNTKEMVDSLIVELEKAMEQKKEIIIEAIKPTPKWIQDMIDAGCTLVEEEPIEIPEGTELI